MKYNILAGILLMMAFICTGCMGRNNAKVYDVTQDEYSIQKSTNEISDDMTVNIFADGNIADEISYDTQNADDLQNTKDSQNLSESAEDEIYIQVCGAVNSPGVYKVPSSLRIFEAVETAGGVTDEAQPDAVNLTKQVYDEMVIYIPTKDEVTNHEYTITDNDIYTQTSENTPKESSSMLVNINTADKETLMTLPGVGESKALAIISYRQENGTFHTIEDIMNVTGIKSAAFEKIKDKITV